MSAKKAVQDKAFKKLGYKKAVPKKDLAATRSKTFQKAHDSSILMKDVQNKAIQAKILSADKA